MLSTCGVPRAQGARETRSRNARGPHETKVSWGAGDESYWSVRRGGVTTSWAAIPLRPHQPEDLHHVRGLRWHGPISVAPPRATGRAGAPVGAPRRSYGYAFALTPRNASVSRGP